MISQCGPRALLKLSPRRAITILKFRSAPLLISQIPGGKHRSRYFLDEFGRSASPIQVLASRDVSRTYKGKSLSVRGSLRGRWVHSPFGSSRLRRRRAACQENCGDRFGDASGALIQPLG